MDKEMDKVKVGYRWIDSLQRHALVISRNQTSPGTSVVASDSDNDTDDDGVGNIKLKRLEQ